MVVAEKFGLSPTIAGVTTAGGALLASQFPKDERWREALYAASLGAGGIVGVQLLAEWMSRKKAGEQKAAQAQEAPRAHRQADGDSPSYVTRTELNDALSQLADKSAQQQKQATCDLLTALREEIRRVVVDMDATPGAAPSRAPAKSASAAGDPYLRRYRMPSLAHDDTRNGGDDYMSSAYGRNAYADEERNAYFDDERNAYPDDERNAYPDDERNAFPDDERNAYPDDERNAFPDDERNAYPDDERNALVEEERNAGDE